METWSESFIRQVAGSVALPCARHETWYMIVRGTHRAAALHLKSAGTWHRGIAYSLVGASVAVDGCCQKSWSDIAERSYLTVVTSERGSLLIDTSIELGVKAVS